MSARPARRPAGCAYWSRRARARLQWSDLRSLAKPLLGDEPSDFRSDLRHSTDLREGVEWHGDVEMIFEFAHEFEHLQRIEAEIG